MTHTALMACNDMTLRVVHATCTILTLFNDMTLRVVHDTYCIYVMQ